MTATWKYAQLVANGTCFSKNDNLPELSTVTAVERASGTNIAGFKGKGAKTNNKDNYRGVTLFPTLCKIYEMILLNRLEKYAARIGFFSELQFGFQEGVGCNEASFTILETITHMLERGSIILSCFLDVRKAFDTVWIDGLPYKLFSDLGIRGRMWLALEIYTQMSKHKFFTRGHCLGKLTYHRVQGRGEF